MSTESDKKPAPQPGISPTERPGPTGGKRQANRLRRTRQLCDAALSLFLATGIESVTIDDIVRRAGVAKGSFYRYFEDKQQLVAAIMEPLFALIRGGLDECAERLNAAEGQTELFAAYLGLAQSFGSGVDLFRDELMLYLQESRAPAVGARTAVCEFAAYVQLRAIEMTHIARDHHLLREDFNPMVTALAVIGATERLLFSYLNRDDGLGDPTAASFILISLALDGLRPKA